VLRVLGSGRAAGGQLVVAAGGPQQRSNSVVQACSQGQATGRCRVSRRAREAIRAGTVTRVRRRVALKWHNITAFENSWVDLANFGMAGYALDAQGVIHLRGIIAGGTSGTAAFTLPASLTHIGNFLIVPIQANVGVGYLEIAKGGTVAPTDNGTSSSVTGGVDLDGVTFSSSTGPDTALTMSNATHGGVFGAR
jgi:hypothetical protein